MQKSNQETIDVMEPVLFTQLREQRIDKCPFGAIAPTLCLLLHQNQGEYMIHVTQREDGSVGGFHYASGEMWRLVGLLKKSVMYN